MPGVFRLFGLGVWWFNLKWSGCVLRQVCDRENVVSPGKITRAEMFEPLAHKFHYDGIQCRDCCLDHMSFYGRFRFAPQQFSASKRSPLRGEL